MVDIHCHILPGLDDGAASLAEAAAMIRIAHASGSTDLVATPHANFHFEYDPARVSEALAQLRAAAEPGVTLHTGCELHLSPSNLDDALAHPAKYTINGKRYLLVEFPDVLIAPSTPVIFDRLLAAGMMPVIAHPERNFLLHRRVADLEQWIEKGCRVQITAQSFLGRFGREVKMFSRMLVERGLVHFVASDAHDARDRAPGMDLAYREVASRFGAPTAERLFVNNPAKVLTGAPVEAAPPGELVPARPWYRFWAL